MKKVIGLEDWVLKKGLPLSKRLAKASVHLKYIDTKLLIRLIPEERKKFIDKFFRESFKKLLETELFDDYRLIGTKRRPRGLETTILIKNLKKLERCKVVEHISINSIEGGKKKVSPKVTPFYCIKMTVAIQVEGIKSGLQTYEERYILVRAQSSEEAYKKAKQKTKDYVKPYLNTDGRFVRWRIESFDGYFETDIVSCEDLNHPEGAEVFSTFKNRKLTKERFWDGKTK